MKQGVCYVVGAGEIADEEIRPQAGDLVIAADGGYLPLVQRGIVPDLLVGDFDSLADVPNDIPVVRHPVQKDDTDMMLAVSRGRAEGYGIFHLYGGLGGRLDHTLANLQMLAGLSEQGLTGYLIGGGQTITAVSDGRLVFNSAVSGILSVFAHGGTAHGVDLDGLFYPLKCAAVTPDVPIGVSNEFIGEQAKVSVTKGTLLVLWSGTPADVIKRE